MKRREFMALLGGAAVAWPVLARAQQATLGYLDGRSPGSLPPFVSGWRDGLRETGFVEGVNLMIHYGWAEGRLDPLPDLAAGLVRRRVDVMLAAGNAAALAAKAASGAIPLVFVAGFDPVKVGLVASLNRPGGHVTGISLQTIDVTAKRLQLLHELAPGAANVAALINPTKPSVEIEKSELAAAARAMGLSLHLLPAANPARLTQL